VCGGADGGEGSGGRGDPVREGIGKHSVVCGCWGASERKGLARGEGALILLRRVLLSLRVLRVLIARGPIRRLSISCMLSVRRSAHVPAIQLRMRITRNLPVCSVHSNIILRSAGSVLAIRVHAAYGVLAVGEGGRRGWHGRRMHVALDHGGRTRARLLLLLGLLLGRGEFVVEEVGRASELGSVESEGLEGLLAVTPDEEKDQDYENDCSGYATCNTSGEGTGAYGG